MPSDNAWLAGVVDGDGWLGIQNGREYKGSMRQYPNLTMTDSSHLLMDALAHMVPKHVLITQRQRTTLYQFVLDSYKRAVPVIEAIRPHLVGKRQQADLICELYRYRQTLPYRTPYGEYEMELKRKVQALKHWCAEVMI